MSKWISCLLIFVVVHEAIAAAQTFSSTIDGLRTGEAFGTTVLGNMLLDGDNVPDFLVGAPAGYTSGATDGKVYVFSGASFQLIRTLAGQPPADEIVHDRFGSSLANVGDINSDGVPDILVGAPATFNGNTRGYVRYFSGDTGATLGVSRANAVETDWGRSVTALQDVTGDGIPDAAFTQPSGLLSSRAFVLSGASPFPGWTLPTFQSSSFWPGPIVGISDVDDDTYDDVVLYLNSLSIPTFEVFSGRTRALIARECTYGAYGAAFPFCTAGESIAASAVRLNDVNGDGVGDFALGFGSGLTGTGAVRIHSGATRKLIRILPNRSLGDMFGSSLANMGDLDGDNVDDILVGAAAHGSPNQHNGYVRCFSGRTGKILFTIEGQNATWQFGASVANAGDLNSDAINDVLIGENLYEPNVSTPLLGRVHVYFSPTDLAAKSCGYRKVGNAIVCL